MDDNMKEVHYIDYCHACEYSEIPVENDPCDECLTISARKHSHKPVNFVAKSENGFGQN